MSSGFKYAELRHKLTLIQTRGGTSDTVGSCPDLKHGKDVEMLQRLSYGLGRVSP